MTYSDKTVYPIASFNQKDFENIMSVYLDAVFYPDIYIHDEIMKQEGAGIMSLTLWMEI